MLAPSATAIGGATAGTGGVSLTCDVQGDAATGTDADGSDAPDWQTTHAAVPCSVDNDTLRWLVRHAGATEVPQGETLVTFYSAITLSHARSRIVFADAVEGTRYLEIIRLVNLHQQGLLFVAHCREYPS